MHQCIWTSSESWQSVQYLRKKYNSWSPVHKLCDHSSQCYNVHKAVSFYANCSVWAHITREVQSTLKQLQVKRLWKVPLGTRHFYISYTLFPFNKLNLNVNLPVLVCPCRAQTLTLKFIGWIRSGFKFGNNVKTLPHMHGENFPASKLMLTQD